jgi:dienelactone hydrolase
MNRRPTATPAQTIVHGIACAGVLLCVAACATAPTTQLNDAQVRAFSASGYAASVEDSFKTTLSNWSLSGQSVHIVLAQPAKVPSTPVVIYLPGLGETSEAGERWRTAWASAGYAVLSVQLLTDDAAEWKLKAVHTADLRTLGRRRYAGAIVSQRVNLLAEMVSVARRKSAAGEPGWQSLDWTKVAIAGFDLGAYTAMTVAGEHVRNAEDAAGRLQVQAAIAISPYASVSAGSFDTRYRDIQVPVLSVTSDVDTDALGIIEGSYLRDAPYTHMNGPNKYLLSLRGFAHAWLSGQGKGTGPKPEAETIAPGPASAENSSSDSKSQRRGRSRERDSDSSGGLPSRDDPAQVALSSSLVKVRVIAVQDISVAFLDAYLKDDAPAREWLSGSASRWLGAAGELRRK